MEHRLTKPNHPRIWDSSHRSRSALRCRRLDFSHETRLRKAVQRQLYKKGAGCEFDRRVFRARLIGFFRPGGSTREMSCAVKQPKRSDDHPFSSHLRVPLHWRPSLANARLGQLPSRNCNATLFGARRSVRGLRSLVLDRVPVSWPVCCFSGRCVCSIPRNPSDLGASSPC